MDNAQKAIMIGVGLFITIIIIAAVMLITGMGQNLLNQGQSQVAGISESLMNDLISQYDGKTLSGAQVKSAAVQLANRDDASIEVGIIDGTDKKDQTIISIDTDDRTTIINSALKNKETVKYVGNVNSTNGKVKIYFVKKGVTYNFSTKT